MCSISGHLISHHVSRDIEKLDMSVSRYVPINHDPSLQYPDCRLSNSEVTDPQPLGRPSQVMDAFCWPRRPLSMSKLTPEKAELGMWCSIIQWLEYIFRVHLATRLPSDLQLVLTRAHLPWAGVAIGLGWGFWWQEEDKNWCSPIPPGGCSRTESNLLYWDPHVQTLTWFILVRCMSPKEQKNRQALGGSSKYKKSP